MCSTDVYSHTATFLHLLGTNNHYLVPVRNYPGSLTMDISGIGGTWNGGEEITVTLDDGDLNLNSLNDEDIDYLTTGISQSSNCYNWYSTYFDYWMLQ